MLNSQIFKTIIAPHAPISDEGPVLKRGFRKCFLSLASAPCKKERGYLLFTIRPVVPEGAGLAMAPPDFGRSVNPISTRGTDYAHLIITGTSGFSHLPTALSLRPPASFGLYDALVDHGSLNMWMWLLCWTYELDHIWLENRYRNPWYVLESHDRESNQWRKKFQWLNYFMFWHINTVKLGNKELLGHPRIDP